MDRTFARTVESLVPSFNRLMEMEPIRGELFPLNDIPRKQKIAGVYLMSEAGSHLYVGRSNDIVSRFYAHRRESSGDGVAAFAFRLACFTSQRTSVSYVSGHPDTRKMKMADPDFRIHFKEAKARIRSMDFRYVPEADPVNQTILEVYCAVALGTPHNTFDNH
ncbi:hypothetical protein [Ensifer canadensis]|uniref:hypothetical protein n=1 Tax=Ensifer canadensis TaxID=555315 RepID=UPI0035E3D5B0